MKRKTIIVMLSVILLALFWVGAVYAQEDSGYPVDDTPVPTETETPPETETPTEEPTETEVPTVTPDPTETETPAPTESPTAEPTIAPTDLPNEDSPVCTGEREHPVLVELAERFGVPYEELVGYFCVDNLGVGEIALALSTLQNGDGTMDLPTLLSMRLEDGMGWGEIWQALGLSGKDHGGVGLLKKDQDRNKNQEQITNEGEETDIENQANFRSQKDKQLNSPPGQEKKVTEGSTEFLPPGQEKKNEDGAEFSPPGQDGKTDDGKPGNGPKDKP